MTATDVALLLLRVGFAGLLALTHGWGTFHALMTGPAQQIAEFPDPLGIGPALSMGLVAFAELFCAAAVAIGLAGRVAAMLLVVSFAVAVFVFHGGDPFSRRELAVHYLVAFTALAVSGPGRISVDAWVARRTGRVRMPAPHAPPGAEPRGSEAEPR